MRVLVVEDDLKIARFVRKGFEAERFRVDWAADVKSAFECLGQREYDLIVLDLRLPDGSGLDVLRSVRARSQLVFVIILSAQGEVDERIRGLELGADDYMGKPFSFAELRARVRALVRRRSPAESLSRIGGLELDRRRGEVALRGKTVKLTPREYDLLLYFVENRDEPLTRAMIADRVWSQSFDTGTNVIDVYVNYLRRKIGSDVIQTVRGVGYQFDSSALESPAE